MRFLEIVNSAEKFIFRLSAGIRRNWKAILIVVLSNILSAFAVANFTLPYRFPDMGVSGLAFLSHYVFDISPSWVIAIGNALLLIWGGRYLNLRFMGLTVCSIAVFTIALPVIHALSLPMPNDKFMATIVSGVIKGFAGAMIFNTGGSGGGTDIIAAVLRRRYGLEIGKFSIMSNCAILALSLGVVGLEAVVYGVVGLYVFGVTLDNVMRSFDRRKQAFIITNIPDEVSRFIMSYGRGVTLIEGHGGYTGQPRTVIITLLDNRQVLMLKTFLGEKDPKAFVSICEASEVLGQGFKSWKSF